MPGSAKENLIVWVSLKGRDYRRLSAFLEARPCKPPMTSCDWIGWPNICRRGPRGDKQTNTDRFHSANLPIPWLESWLTPTTDSGRRSLDGRRSSFPGWPGLRGLLVRIEGSSHTCKIFSRPGEARGCSTNTSVIH